MPRVSSLLTIDEEAEPPEGVIPVGESDIPVFISGSQDSQAVREGLGATEPARTTAVTVTEVPSADEPSPDSSDMETSRRPIRHELQGFVDPVDQLSTPSQAWHRGAGAFREWQSSIGLVTATLGSVTSASSNLPISLKGERQAPSGIPYPKVTPTLPTPISLGILPTLFTGMRRASFWPH